MKRRTVTIALLLALLPASLLLAGAEGRLKGVVVDQDGKPVVGADVLLMAQEVNAERRAKTKKGGKFTMIVADASRTYTIRIGAEGYQTIQEPVKLEIGGQLTRTWTLRTGETVAGASMVEKHAPGGKTYNEGAKAFNNGQIDVALAKFIEAGEENPELAEAFQGQAMIYWSRSQTDLALAAAEKLVALDPVNVVGLRVSYDAYSEKKDERAPKVLDALIAADPSPATARRVFNTGVAAVQANDSATAISRFEKVVELDPTIPQSYQILGQLYNSKGESDKAIAIANKLLEMQPGSPEAHSVLYTAYSQTGDKAKADESLAILKSAKPADLAKAFYEEGQALFNAGNVAQATAKLEQAIETDPNLAAAYYTLGLCYLNAGDQAAARKHLEKLLELDPEHPEAASAKDMLSFLQ